MGRYFAKQTPKQYKASGRMMCPLCKTPIKKVESNMYLQCKCGEWRNDPLLGWEFIPKGSEHSQYKEK